MISDSELAAAVEGCAHWRLTRQDSTVFEVPGQPGSVRVGRIRRPPQQGPTRHDRYFAALIRQGRAVHSASFGFASEAVVL
jgi:hypothetical protein